MERLKPKIFCEEGLTKQAHKAECDINNIMNRYHKSGILPNTRKGIYGDFSSVEDYQRACDTVIQANEQFNGLNAKIRQRFSNNPAAFLDFCNNPDNIEEMITLGLAERKKPVSGTEPNKDKTQENNDKKN